MYEWVNKTAVAPLPTWLLDLLRPATPVRRLPTRPVAFSDQYVEVAVREEAVTVANTAPGSRNHALNAAAFSLGTLVGAGRLEEWAAASALLEAALTCGLTESEAAATIRSGLTAGRRHPRGATA